jgi:type I restriction enzyme M protein
MVLGSPARLYITYWPCRGRLCNESLAALKKLAAQSNVKLTAKREKLLQTELAQKDEVAQPVIEKIHKPGKVEANYFYKPQPLRTLAKIRADIVALENENKGLLEEIIGGIGLI